MKKGALSFLAAGALCIALLAACSCGGGGGSETTKPSTGNPPVNTPTGGELVEMKSTAGTIKEHTLAEIDKSLDTCTNCHAEFSSKYDQIRMPTPTTYYSFVQKTEFKVVAGSNQDHTGVTNAKCFDAGCHVKP